MGTRLSCSCSKYKNNRTFHSFHEQEIVELLAKNIARTASRQLDGRHLLLEDICGAEQPIMSV